MKEIINVTDFKDTAAIQNLVGRCLDAVKPLSLELHVKKCVQRWQEYNQNIVNNICYPKLNQF
jgi:hypothetical protein